MIAENDQSDEYLELMAHYAAAANQAAELFALLGDGHRDLLWMLGNSGRLATLSSGAGEFD